MGRVCNIKGTPDQNSNALLLITDMIIKLEKSLNKDVEIIKEVDESIIAGLIIRVGDIVLDNSIKTKIKKMSKNDIYTLRRKIIL